MFPHIQRTVPVLTVVTVSSLIAHPIAQAVDSALYGIDNTNRIHQVREEDRDEYSDSYQSPGNGGGGTVVVTKTNDEELQVYGLPPPIENQFTPVIEHFDHINIDDSDAGFSRTGMWMNMYLAGLKGGLLYSNDDDATATWTFRNLEPGHYKIYATWHPFQSLSERAPFSVETNETDWAGVTTLVNQQADWRQRDHIIEVILKKGNEITITLQTTDDGYVVADSVFLKHEQIIYLCPDVYNPVCGVDGKTYGNSCEADAAGVEIKHKGSCDGHEIFEPLCPVYDMDIPPEGCKYVDEKDDNGCPVPKLVCENDPPIYCNMLHDPVCGVDGVTYSNSCLAQGAGVEVKHHGPCDKPEFEISPQICPVYDMALPPEGCRYVDEDDENGCPVPKLVCDAAASSGDNETIQPTAEPQCPLRPLQWPPPEGCVYNHTTNADGCEISHLVCNQE